MYEFGEGKRIISKINISFHLRQGLTFGCSTSCFRTHNIGQAGLGFTEVHLPLLREHWD